MNILAGWMDGWFAWSFFGMDEKNSSQSSNEKKYLDLAIAKYTVKANSFLKKINVSEQLSIFASFSNDDVNDCYPIINGRNSRKKEEKKRRRMTIEK